MTPTPQQEAIINYNGNAVIIAAPGSGKTFVISQKIRKIIKNIKDYEGVIAISYTNKASNELSERCLKNGIDPKSSFFGTIDKFFISEIIIPFAKQLFGLPKNDIKITKLDSLEEIQQADFNWFSRDIKESNLTDENVNVFKNYFLKGIVPLDTVGVLACYIFKQSLSCRKYLKSRYKYIFIDEYQDSGFNQHSIFSDIVSLGLIGVAVGDLNQSIYAFSGKDSKFLSSLKNNTNFKTFLLTQNHRCHPSIINYSSYFLDKNVDLLQIDERRVYYKRTQGDETTIATFIDNNIERIKKFFNIENNSSLAILTRSNRSIDTISSKLITPNKVSLNTELDLSLNVWSGIFSNLLRFAYDKNFRFIEIIESFTNYERLNKSFKTLLNKLKNEVIELFAKEINVTEIEKRFYIIAQIIAPNSRNKESTKLLNEVLSNKELLHSYKPAENNEINIMTIHKSKGLEFDAIFHIDLYDWIIPLKRPGENYGDPVNYVDLIQDMNLHYVAITRARHACFLITSSERTNAKNAKINANDSEFLTINDIQKLRYNGK